MLPREVWRESCRGRTRDEHRIADLGPARGFVDHDPAKQVPVVGTIASGVRRGDARHVGRGRTWVAARAM
jgi:hypothetical protein